MDGKLLYIDQTYMYVLTYLDSCLQNHTTEQNYYSHKHNIQELCFAISMVNTFQCIREKFLLHGLSGDEAGVLYTYESILEKKLRFLMSLIKSSNNTILIKEVFRDFLIDFWID